MSNWRPYLLSTPSRPAMMGPQPPVPGEIAKALFDRVEHNRPGMVHMRFSDARFDPVTETHIAEAFRPVYSGPKGMTVREFEQVLPPSGNDGLHNLEDR